MQIVCVCVCFCVSDIVCSPWTLVRCQRCHPTKVVQKKKKNQPTNKKKHAVYWNRKQPLCSILWRKQFLLNSMLTLEGAHKLISQTVLEVPALVFISFSFCLFATLVEREQSIESVGESYWFRLSVPSTSSLMDYSNESKFLICNVEQRAEMLPSERVVCCGKKGAWKCFHSGGLCD